MAGQVQQVEVLIRQPGVAERRAVVSAGITHLGRAEDNDIVLPDIGVSRRHARIVIDDTRVRIEDMGSGNGTYAAGRPVDAHEISDGDEVIIDPFVLSFTVRRASDPARPAAPALPKGGGRTSGPPARLVVLAGQRLASSYIVGEAGLSMGRSDGRDIILFDPAASRRHASIELRGSDWWLVDHGSANGTWVDAERARELMLTSGQVIRIGSTELRFERLDDPNLQPDAFHEKTAAAIPAALTERHRAPSPALVPMGDDLSLVQERPTSVDLPSPVVLRQARPTPASPPRRSMLGAALVMAVAAGVVFFGLLLIAGAAVGVYWWQVGDLGLTSTDLEVAPSAGLLPAAPLYPVDSTPPGKAKEVNALLELGELQLRQERPLEAAAQFFKALQLAPAHHSGQREGYLSCELIAFEELRAALVANSADASSRKAARKAALELEAAATRGEGSVGVARREVDRALRLMEGDRELILAQGRLRAAEEAALAAPDLPALRSFTRDALLRGQEALDSGNPTQAILEFDTVLAADPSARTAASFVATDSRLDARGAMTTSMEAATASADANQLGPARVILETLAAGGQPGADRALEALRPRLQAECASQLSTATQAVGAKDSAQARASLQQLFATCGPSKDPSVQGGRDQLSKLRL